VLNVGEGDVAVSLLDSGGQVVVELDDIAPALWQIMAANVYDGDYTLVCRPPNGEGVSTDIAVG
jgi:hypothetical protein